MDSVDSSAKDLELIPKGGVGKLALVVQDVQREFCDPALPRGTTATDQLAGRIESLVPLFRAAGLPVFVVQTKPAMTIGKFEGDFHRFQPHTNDTLVQKSGNSAVANGTLLELLREKGAEKVLVCGFNLSACIRETVFDLLAWDMPVTVLRDLCGNDKLNEESAKTSGGVAADVVEMVEQGARLTTSTKALSFFK